MPFELLLILSALLALGALILLILTKKNESESRIWRAFRLACYTLILIIVLPVVFVVFIEITIRIKSFPIFAGTFFRQDSFGYFTIIVYSILNCAMVYFITKKLKFINSRTKRVGYSILAIVCSFVIVICFVLIFATT